MIITTVDQKAFLSIIKTLGEARQQTRSIKSNLIEDMKHSSTDSCAVIDLGIMTKNIETLSSIEEMLIQTLLNVGNMHSFEVVKQRKAS